MNASKNPTYTFINFQQKVPPIRLFPPILLLLFTEISHLYFYLEPSSIWNSRVFFFHIALVCKFLQVPDSGCGVRRQSSPHLSFNQPRKDFANKSRNALSLESTAKELMVSIVYETKKRMFVLKLQNIGHSTGDEQ